MIKICNREQVSEFLKNHYTKPVSELVELFGGKHSRAYSYDYEGTDYVIRFNPSNRGFLKDQYAHENFSLGSVSIPKVYEVGQAEETIYYCISEKITGETVRDRYRSNNYDSLPAQYELIDEIAGLSLGDLQEGFGEWEPNAGRARYSSYAAYISALYRSNDVFNWREFDKLAHFDRSFADYLFERLEHFAEHSEIVRELVHGDFGNENVFLSDNKIVGLIDWDKFRFADRFLDVGRVILYCPSREATVSSALEYFGGGRHKNYKERITMGVYYTMLANYGFAARDNNIASSKSSPKRINHFERLMDLD